MSCLKFDAKYWNESPQDEAFQAQAADSQSVNGFLTLVRVAQCFRVPAQFESFQLGAVLCDAVNQLVDQYLNGSTEVIHRRRRMSAVIVAHGE